MAKGLSGSAPLEPTENMSSAIVATARDAAALLAPVLAPAGAGAVAILHLDAERRLIGIGGHEAEEDPGTLPIRAIIAEALRLGAEGIVLGRNRPDGDASPGEAEREAARALADTARSLGIRLFDLLVFSAGEVRSFRELGLL